MDVAMATLTYHALLRNSPDPRQLLHARPPPMMSSAMTLTQAYEEILDFLAAGTTAESIANFRPSEKVQARVRELIDRRNEAKITPSEEEELDEYLRLEHLMIMAKAQAQIRLKS